MTRDPDELDRLLARAVEISDRRDDDIEAAIGWLATGAPLDVVLGSVRSRFGDQRFNLVEREFAGAILAHFNRKAAA